MDKLKEKIENYVPYNEQEENDKEMMLNYINTFEDTLTRKNRMCHFTASSWIVNRERTKVLMVHHNIFKSWTCPGGHCDGDSDVAYVALKETKEETGLKNINFLLDEVFSIEIVTIDGHKKNGKYVPSHLHLNCTFLLEADEHEELIIKEDENSAVKWVDINEVPKLISEAKMIDIYKKWNEKLAKI